MKLFRIRRLQRDAVLATRVGLADKPWSRLKGLLGRSHLDPDEGLLLFPCKAVHMWGMRFPLDVAFLDASGCVIATYQNLKPGQRTKLHRLAQYALELPAGTLARTGTGRGDFLTWEAA